jgi:hypothetical protein
MLTLLAMSEAAKTTIAGAAVWLVGFPILVQGLIVYAVIQARGEAAANRRHRGQRRR